MWKLKQIPSRNIKQLGRKISKERLADQRGPKNKSTQFSMDSE